MIYYIVRATVGRRVPTCDRVRRVRYVYRATREGGERPIVRNHLVIVVHAREKTGNKMGCERMFLRRRRVSVPIILHLCKYVCDDCEFLRGKKKKSYLFVSEAEEEKTDTQYTDVGMLMIHKNKLS